MRGPGIAAALVAALGIMACSKPSSPVTLVPEAAVVVVPAPTIDPVQHARREALALLNAGDLDGALRRLDGAIGAAGEGDAAVMLRCDRAAVMSRRAVVTTDLRTRERDLRAAHTDCPGDDALITGLSDTLLRRAREADDDDVRLALLQESVALRATVAGLVDLAVLLEKRNEPTDAADAADRAVTLDPGDARLVALRDRLKKVQGVEGTFKSARHSHFVARFEGYGDERLAWGALDTLETAWFSVGKALDLYPTEPITVVIYTGAQYQAATAGPDWSTGLFDGKIRIREGQLAAEKGSLDDTLVHEYVHAALHTLPVPVPSWFHEGLAQHFEKQRTPPSYALPRVGVAPRGNLDVPFTSLPAAAVPSAYVTAHAIVERMVERRGAFGLNQLIAELKGGRDFDDAVQRAFAVSVDLLYRDVANP